MREGARTSLAAVCALDRREGYRPSHFVERLSPTDAFTALVAHSFSFKPQSREQKRRMMRDYLEVVSRLPIFRLRYRPGFEAFSAVLDEVDKSVLQSIATRT